MVTLLQGLIVIDMIFKLAEEKHWNMDNYTEECRYWVTILLSLIDFSHEDTPACISQVTQSKGSFERLSRYINLEVKVV